MGGKRTAPSRIINTPGGSRERTRMAGESMEKDQRRRRSAFAPRKRRPMFTDRGERVQDKDMEARRSRRMERREERKQTFGDDFREERKERRERRRERRRQARDFFGKVMKRRGKRGRDPDMNTAEEKGGQQIGMISQVGNKPNIAKQDI